jgi:hypothetical protein
MLHIEGVYTNAYSETNENVDKSLSIYLLNEIRIYRLRRKLYTVQVLFQCQLGSHLKTGPASMD